jgi:hypothetical protein
VTHKDVAPTTILFASDGTSSSRDARGAAAYVARSSGAALHIVHVWTPASTIGGAQGVDQAIASGVVSRMKALATTALRAHLDLTGEVAWGFARSECVGEE